MAIKNGEGIGYIQDVGTWSVYHIMMKGREVLEISVDNEDPDLKIWVGRPGSREAAVTNSEILLSMLGAPIVTKGRAKKELHEVGGSDTTPGELKDHIDGMTVYGYVITRLPVLMADVYVPVALTEG